MLFIKEHKFFRAIFHLSRMNNKRIIVHVPKSLTCPYVMIKYGIILQQKG